MFTRSLRCHSTLDELLLARSITSGATNTDTQAHTLTPELCDKCTQFSPAVGMAITNRPPSVSLPHSSINRMNKVFWIELAAVFLVSLIVPLTNLLVGSLRPENCSVDQILGLAPSTLLVILGSTELILIPIALARVTAASTTTYHGFGAIRVPIDAILCFLLGAALFPTATAACYGSVTFSLLIADFCLYVASLAVVFNDWFYLARDTLRVILYRPG